MSAKGWLLPATIAALAVLPHLPGLNADFGRSLLTQMVIAAVFALSFNMLFGQTGLLSFGHAVYFGLGGYAAIHLMRAINGGLPVPMLLVPVAGAAGGLLAGALLGALTTRKAGTIFALISLGVGELVYAATFMLPGWFGGEEGITASRTRTAFAAGPALDSQLAVYYAVAAWALVAALLVASSMLSGCASLNAVRAAAGAFVAPAPAIPASGVPPGSPQPGGPPPGSPSSFATVIRDAGMPKAAVISDAEKAETVSTCAALLALPR